MGYYINSLGDGTLLPAKGKADFLLTNIPGAKEISHLAINLGTETYDNLVCVVENGVFDAAGWAFNASEIKAFLPTYRDRRPRRWLLVPNANLLAK